MLVWNPERECATTPCMCYNNPHKTVVDYAINNYIVINIE